MPLAQALLFLGAAREAALSFEANHWTRLYNLDASLFISPGVSLVTPGTESLQTHAPGGELRK